MKTAIHTQDTTNACHAAGKRALKAGLALAAACLAATSVQASPYGGSIFNPETNQTTTIMRGHHGEARSVEHGNRMGHLEDMMQRRITSRIFGSVFDPETGYATTVVQGPNGYARSVERRNGPRRPNRWQLGYSRVSGSLYNPETGQTTIIVRGPNGEASTVEDGNTLGQRSNMQPPRATSRMSGSLHNPETNTTTTIIRGPNGSVSTTEPGNTLGRR